MRYEGRTDYTEDVDCMALVSTESPSSTHLSLE